MLRLAIHGTNSKNLVVSLYRKLKAINHTVFALSLRQFSSYIVFQWTAFPVYMKEVINLMAAKPASVRFFVIFLSLLYSLYYRRASSTENIMPTTAFKTASEAEFFCGLLEVLIPVVLPTIL
jgi:hypothetical protein